MRAPKNRPKLTDQQIFDRAATQMLDQNQRTKAGNSCVYLSPNGLKCAVGGFFRNTRAVQRLALTLQGSVLINQVQACLDFEPSPTQVREILLSLQEIHDSYNPASWRERLLALAASLGLKTEVIEERHGKTTK